jgi:hypothetical protein
MSDNLTFAVTDDTVGGLAVVVGARNHPVVFALHAIGVLAAVVRVRNDTVVVTGHVRYCLAVIVSKGLDSVVGTCVPVSPL